MAANCRISGSAEMRLEDLTDDVIRKERSLAFARCDTTTTLLCDTALAYPETSAHLRRSICEIIDARAERDLFRVLRDSLRYREDMIVTNPFSEVVWLKIAYDGSGKRIGLTECCLADEPCDRHAAIKTAAPSGSS